MAFYDAMTAAPSSQAFINPQAQHFGFQGTEGAASRSLEAELAVTPLIRHLPEAIPHDALSRLFSHYGASAVRPCSSGRLSNCAFVDFKIEALASQAQCQLNGLRFLGKVLSVQRASKSTEDNKLQQAEAQSRKDFQQHTSVMKGAALTRDFSDGSKSGSIPASEPIAARLGVDYPFPPHLECC